MTMKTCIEEGCTRAPKWRGLCQPHYLQDQYRDRPRPSQDELGRRFWAKVEPTGFCWNWTAAVMKARGGYGAFGWNEMGKNVTVYAHRFAYELLVGPIPDGLQLDHLCRNPRCVNPDHLDPVSSKVNSHRGFGSSGNNRRKTHCKYGHEFTPDNTYIAKGRYGPQRQCKTCGRDNARRYREAKK